VGDGACVLKPMNTSSSILTASSLFLLSDVRQSHPAVLYVNHHSSSTRKTQHEYESLQQFQKPRGLLLSALNPKWFDLQRSSSSLFQSPPPTLGLGNHLPAAVESHKGFSIPTLTSDHKCHYRYGINCSTYIPQKAFYSHCHCYDPFYSFILDWPWPFLRVNWSLAIILESLTLLIETFSRFLHWTCGTILQRLPDQLFKICWPIWRTGQARPDSQELDCEGW